MNCGAFRPTKLVFPFRGVQDTSVYCSRSELSADSQFQLDATRLVSQLREARALRVTPKPIVVGPVTYLHLGKAKDDSDKLALLPRLLPVYRELLSV